MSNAPKDIRITDSYLRRLVAQEQQYRGDATATQTAGRLVLERLTELEYERRRQGAQQQSTPKASKAKKSKCVCNT